MKQYDTTQPISFKQGVYRLNKEKNFDFQLNRVINWNGGKLDEVAEIADKIQNSEDWKRELVALGYLALKEDRIKHAIAYFRMSEFFMHADDPDKQKYYLLATQLFDEFYRDYFQAAESGSPARIERLDVPFEKIKLPVLHVKPVGRTKGVLLLHGGNDSYYEEFLFPLLYLQEKGYEVYLFEGPGQGSVIRLQGMHFTHEWEKPVGALLDFFQLRDVTIIGASLGGYLAPRAAAFDKRITRVVAWSIFPCFLDVIISDQKPSVQKLLHLMLQARAKKLINLIFRHKARKNPMISWGLSHGLYAYQADCAYDYAQKLKRYDLAPIADQITQDILILGAKHDHFIPYHLIGHEIKLLKNVRSLTFRLFTDQENAQNHCNVGNVKLVFDTICAWLDDLKNRDQTAESFIVQPSTLLEL